MKSIAMAKRKNRQKSKVPPKQGTTGQALNGIHFVCKGVDPGTASGLAPAAPVTLPIAPPPSALPEAASIETASGLAPAAPVTVAGPALPPIPRGPNQYRIVERLGQAVLSETYDMGAHTGYRIYCGRHRNINQDLPCEKTITMGKTADRLSEVECQRRLKCWFILGNRPETEAKWPADQQRAGHMEYGGRRLAQLSSDMFGDWSTDDLNDMCRNVLPPPGLAPVVQ